MNSPAIRAYRFGNFRVSLRRRELRDGTGSPVSLSARAYDALVFLLENRERVVSKDELMKAIWPQTVVEENNLNQAITILRKALGDRRDAAQYVRTVAGRGYQFVGEVTEELEDARTPQPPGPETGQSVGELETSLPRPASAQPVPASAAVVAAPDLRRRLLIGLGLAAIAGGAAAWLSWRMSTGRTARLRSLAVLPFRPLVAESGDPVLEFGMTDALITRLSGLPGLVVRPLSSVRKYAAPDQNSLEAGRELDAETVLEGYLLIRQNQVRLTARLLEVGSGAALWTGSFEESLDQFLDAQDALAAQVVGALQLELTENERRNLLERPTDDVRAWQLYSSARYLWERKTPEAFRRAIEYYEAAERLDPGFALAAVGEADAWAALGVFSAMPPADAFGRARAAAERALRTAPELPEALAAMGHILVQGQRDWRGGERLYRRALDAKPRFAQCRMWLANDCAFQGRLREGLTEAGRAQELEPLSPTFAANVGNLLYYLRDYAAALAQLEPLVEADPGFQLARQHLARVLVASGAPEKAIPLLMEGRSAPGAIGLSNLGRAFAAAGRRELAEGELRRLEEQGARGIGVGYDLALIHAALGDEASSLSAIERAVRDGSQGIGFLNSEPGFDPIREKPRFRAVSHQLGLG